MKKLKLFEEYVESADYKISVFFKELKNQIEKWFTDGSLAAQGCELDGDIQISNYNPMEKFLIFNFLEPIEPGENEENDDNSAYRYRVTFMLRLDQMQGNGENSQSQAQEGGEGVSLDITSTGKDVDINKILLKIHQFNDDNTEKGELVEEFNVEDIKEDFIIDKIGQLKDESGDKDVDSNDLKDNIRIA